eukprot:TRINITY_DN9979_c0_g1_i1.p1 TRINITY_DN9979_c0_g1~~TRINITY_DN9979_c0_g1_i1.p1  ORF type:complete len:180 (-),score=12.36 TRINITY_DN9979_c0_g1_i1:123-662(-)
MRLYTLESNETTLAVDISKKIESTDYHVALLSSNQEITIWCIGKQQDPIIVYRLSPNISLPETKLFFKYSSSGEVCLGSSNIIVGYDIFNDTVRIITKRGDDDSILDFLNWDKTIIVLSKDMTIHFYFVDTGEKIGELNTGMELKKLIKFHVDKNKLVIATEKEVVCYRVSKITKLHNK